jgi:succinylarginine dihydrolase
MSNDAIEVNFDGIVGPTHNYAGLSPGNLASQKHVNQPSHPRQAALQGLAKMKLLADMGIRQAVLPPHERPDMTALRSAGFTGSDAQVLEQAAKENPHLLAASSSSSAMWTANAATVSPSADTVDGRVHITPANLFTLFHRSLEACTTTKILKTIFADEEAFAVHPPLASTELLADEGAANHMRLTPAHGHPGTEIFVYGRDSTNRTPTKFPARQTLQASQSIANQHHLRNAHFIQQNPAAIDAGAFHNDVVAVSNLNVLLYHTSAWLTKPIVDDLYAIEVTETELPLADAVSSYLFNSQLVGTDRMTLIAPIESQENPNARRFLEQLPQRNTPIKEIKYVDVRQSMKNGGGPACLRLRVVLTQDQITRIKPRVFLDDAQYQELTNWVTRNYRETLTPADLADPKLLEESRRALDELSQILALGPIYPFQQAQI